jgi:type IV secretion system protein TrbL
VRTFFAAHLAGRRSGWLVVATLVVIACLAAPQLVAQQQGVLDSAQDFYRQTTRTWLAPISAIARRLFVTLAAIEISISGMVWSVRRDSLDEMAAKFLFKFIILSFVLLLITGAGFWLRPLVNSLAVAGSVAGVVPVPAGPSEVVDLGIRVAFANLDLSNLPVAFSSFATLAFFVISRLTVMVAFIAVAGLLVLAWVESYVALAGGVLFLGFGGFRATAQYAENYLNYLIYLGVRLFVFYLLLSAGTTIIATYIPPNLRVTTPQEMTQVVAITVIFAVLVLRIPSNMASRVAAGGNFGIAQALRSF